MKSVSVIAFVITALKSVQALPSPGLLSTFQTTLIESGVAAHESKLRLPDFDDFHCAGGFCVLQSFVSNSCFGSLETLDKRFDISELIPHRDTLCVSFAKLGWVSEPSPIDTYEDEYVDCELSAEETETTNGSYKEFVANPAFAALYKQMTALTKPIVLWSGRYGPRKLGVEDIAAKKAADVGGITFRQAKEKYLPVGASEKFSKTEMDNLCRGIVQAGENSGKILVVLGKTLREGNRYERVEEPELEHLKEEKKVDTVEYYEVDNDGKAVLKDKWSKPKLHTGL